MIIISFINSLTMIFMSLYIIDLFGYVLAGFLLSISTFMQFIFDFPSGVLSDLVGQKTVGILSFITVGIGFILIGTIKIYSLFIIAVAIFGIGLGLFQGLIQTWFDNNYHFLMKQNTDTDRSVYGAVMARVRSLFFLVGGISVILGTNLASHFSRNLVFVLDGIIAITFSFALIFLMKNMITEEKSKEQVSFTTKIGDYFGLIGGSLSHIYHDKLLLMTIIGRILFLGSLGQVFMYLILFPLIFGYTGNDVLLGLSGSILSFVLAINVFIIGILAKRFRKQHYPIFVFLYVVLFLSCLLILVKFVPPQKQLNWLAIIILVILYVFFDSFIGEIAVNLQFRVFLDLVPSKYRNSILSIFTSSTAIFVTILFSIVGIIVYKYGILGGLLFMEFIGILGSLFLIPILFSKRMKAKS